MIGRPPMAIADRRTTLVRVLTTEAEHGELQRAAEADSMSVSTWVRAVALAKARHDDVWRKAAAAYDAEVDDG